MRFITFIAISLVENPGPCEKKNWKILGHDVKI